MDVSGKRNGKCHNAEQNNKREKRRQYKGISMRKWGKWVAEVRIPKCRTKIWLGSYDTAEQAARAFDAAVYCLRGPNAKLNFPNSIPAIPSASSLSRQQIQLVAAKYALDQIPAADSCVLTEESASPSESFCVSESFSVSETEAPSDGNAIYEQQDLTLDYLLRDSYINLERCPSFNDSGFLQLPSYAVTEEQLLTESSVFFDTGDLWNFELF